MPDFILIDGAPGSGKNTLARRLAATLASPAVDFGVLRQFHLDRDWQRASEREEAMAAEGLLGLLTNYFRHGCRDVIVHDLRFQRLRWLAARLEGDAVFIHLHVKPAILRARLNARTVGFRDIPTALAWNERVGLAKEGWRIDNDAAPDKTASRVLGLLEGREGVSREGQ